MGSDKFSHCTNRICKIRNIYLALKIWNIHSVHNVGPKIMRTSVRAYHMCLRRTSERVTAFRNDESKDLEVGEELARRPNMNLDGRNSAPIVWRSGCPYFNRNRRAPAHWIYFACWVGHVPSPSSHETPDSPAFWFLGLGRTSGVDCPNNTTLVFLTIPLFPSILSWVFRIFYAVCFFTFAVHLALLSCVWSLLLPLILDFRPEFYLSMLFLQCPFLQRISYTSWQFQSLPELCRCMYATGGVRTLLWMSLS